MSEENDRQKIELSLDTPPEIYTNTGSPYVVITEDKVNLILKEYSANLEKKNRWHTPLAILLTIIVTLLTANFDNTKLGFESGTWSAFFIMGALISTYWLVRDVYKACQTNTNVTDIVEKFKDQTNLIKRSNQE